MNTAASTQPTRQVIKRAYPTGKLIPHSALRVWMSDTQRQTVKRVHARRSRAYARQECRRWLRGLV
jgi:hypothetical protein